MHSTILKAILLWNCCTVLNALFTVQTMKSQYTVEYGSDVTMECHFPMTSESDVKNLNVLWKHSRDNEKSVELVKYLNGREVLILQDKDYTDRVKLLSHELYNGRAVLQIRNVTITDAGQYFCIISSQGSDYKMITLEVQAPYKEITTRVTDVVTLSGETMKEISCQSFGYPEAEVTWQSDRGNLSLVPNTSYTLTDERLFNVTSVIRILDAANRTFTCLFWNKAIKNSTWLTFTLPVSETNSKEKSRDWIFAAVTVIILLILTVTVLIVLGRWKSLSVKGTNLYNNIHTNETHCINASMLSTGKCSDHNSEHTAIEVENT
ncbi:programmed cell death 1 ligand 1-like [Pseudophryne corroboree]|uniref:programmed cell death 1 ligand 1-like n=1 Tax=Pseudophryne corroboree TaxID=495146 RepID=UPI003081FDA1